MEKIFSVYSRYLQSTPTSQRALIAICHLRKTFGNTSLRDISKKVPEYIASRQVSAGTINRELGVLQSALRYAFKQGITDFMPAIMKLPSPPPRAQFLSHLEVEALLNASSSFPEVDRFIRIALMTGQRKEAILSLRWDQVDFEANLIDFNDPSMPFASRRKGRGTVPMSQALRAFMEGLGEDSIWVIHRNGKRIRDFRADWAKIMKASGLNITPHILRHTVATHLAQKNVPMPQIARILGHANSQITERVYAKFSPDFCKQAVEHLSV